MKITEIHENGSEVTVSGFGARKFVAEWRKVQDAKPMKSDDDKEPRFKSTGTIFLGGDDREYESGPKFERNEVATAFGFVANERNVK